MSPELFIVRGSQEAKIVSCAASSWPGLVLPCFTCFQSPRTPGASLTAGEEQVWVPHWGGEDGAAALAAGAGLWCELAPGVVS